MNPPAIAATLILAAAPLALATEGSTAPQSLPAVAEKSAPGKARKASAAEVATVEKFVSLQDAAIATFLELGGTLRGVKDRESADAAAPAVKMSGEQLYTIISAVEALGEPSEAAQQAIMARVANVAEKNEIVEQVMLPLLTLMMQQPPCYGSEALQVELTHLLTNLQGADGAEEEDEALVPPAPLQEPDADEQQPTEAPAP